MRRVGARNQPSYRIVAADKESPRDGRFLEAIGFYNPRTEPSTVQIDEARLFHWMQHGAQPSDSVVQALRPIGTWERWERLKAGEEIEKLLKEAEDALPVVDPRTRRDDLFETRQKKKKKPRKDAKAQAEDAEAEDEPAAETTQAEEKAAVEEAKAEAGPTSEKEEVLESEDEAGAEVAAAEAAEGTEAEAEPDSEEEKVLDAEADQAEELEAETGEESADEEPKSDSTEEEN
jgi:small subunit ribosomal protein S16